MKTLKKGRVDTRQMIRIALSVAAPYLIAAVLLFVRGEQYLSG